MSELIQKNDNRATIRWKLLTGVSAVALTAYISSATLGRAEDSGQPQIWIDLSGQLSQLEDSQEIFAPAFLALRPSIFSPSQKFERPPLYSIDEGGKISFQPDNSDWVFSASIRYGRSSSNRHVRQQTYPSSIHFLIFNYYPGTAKPFAARFADTNAHNSETHSILDFQAGKDVGLGVFGRNGSSVVSAGVRFAQFGAKSDVALKSDPDWHISSATIYGTKLPIYQPYHSYSGSMRAKRSFHGVGPSLSWSASAPFAGNPQDGELALNWGANAALLFGRQRAKTHHQTTARYHPKKYGSNRGYVVYQGPATPDHTRSRDVTVPNLGGTVGLSYRIENFKVSAGYRADFFFNAMDGGIDTRKSQNRSFMGPYASISIGLGG